MRSPGTALVLVVLAGSLVACAGGEGDDGTGASPEELHHRGFVDAGSLLVAADGTEFRSDIRAALTAVVVPPDVEVEIEDSWSIVPTMERDVIRFARVVNDRRYFAALYALDEEGHSRTFRWLRAAPRPELSEEARSRAGETVLLLTIYSGAPFTLGLPPRQAAGAGWHEATIDERGHLWLYPRPEPAVALDTGEAIDMSAMREIGWWPVRLPFPDLITLCGTKPECHVISKGGIYVPASMADAITCTPNFDGAFSFLTLSATKGDLTLEFDVTQADANCAEVLRSRSYLDELPVAFRARAREASTGRLLDLVASADGRLYVGDSSPHLRCPPCAAGFG